MVFRDGKYWIDGIEVNDIAGRYGTPVYIYSSGSIVRMYKQLLAALGNDRTKIMYACKALSNPSVLRLFKKLGAGLDVVSVEELRLGLHAGFEGRDIIFTPSMVSGTEYDIAVAAGVRINVGDLPALEYLSDNHPGYPVCVRINPHVYAGGHEKISVGHKHSKFGISIHQLDDLLRLVEKKNIAVDGIHMHVGSDIQDDDHYLEAMGVLFEKAILFPGLKYVDVGSGYKIAYREGQSISDLQKIGKAIQNKRLELEKKLGCEIEILTEPGKILVSDAGIFIASVNTVKRTPSKTFVGLNTGFNHLVRPMLYDAWHDIVNVSNPGGKMEKADIVGYICETDTFAKDRSIPFTKPGDLLVFKNAGAYGYNMASNYNSKFRPPEVLIYEGKDYLIRRRETLDDLIATVVDPKVI